MQIGDIVHIRKFKTKAEGDAYVLEHQGKNDCGYEPVIMEHAGDDYQWEVIHHNSVVDLKPIGFEAPCWTFWPCCVYKKDTCRCEVSLLKGCTCGYFEREQERRGFFKNPYTRLWEQR